MEQRETKTTKDYFLTGNLVQLNQMIELTLNQMLGVFVMMTLNIWNKIYSVGFFSITHVSMICACVVYVCIGL